MGSLKTLLLRYGDDSRGVGNSRPFRCRVSFIDYKVLNGIEQVSDLGFLQELILGSASGI